MRSTSILHPKRRVAIVSIGIFTSLLTVCAITLGDLDQALAESHLLDCDLPNGLIHQVLVVNQAGTLKLREFAKDGEIFQRDLTPKEWEKKQFKLTIKRLGERASLFFEQNQWRYWLSAPNYNAAGTADCDRFH